MRKLKLQMQISIDGFVSTGPDDDQKWITWAYEEIRGHVIELLDSCDTIIMGRNMAEEFIPYWKDVVKNPDLQMHELGVRIVQSRNIVFTRSLQESKWEDTEIAKGDLTEEIRKLKQQPGKDIMVYGGSSFVSSLIREGLIDEYHFFLNPVALGKGMPIFDKLDHFRKFQLQHTIVYNCGIVLLHYDPI